MRWCPLISQVCLSGLGSVVDKMRISMISSTSKKDVKKNTELDKIVPFLGDQPRKNRTITDSANPR